MTSESAKAAATPPALDASAQVASQPSAQASVGIVLHLDALLGDTPAGFVDALCRLAAAWPEAFLSFVRDPERVAIVCRALRDSIGLPSEARRSSS